MPLTRPTVAQLNTVVTEISDPISVLNRGSTQANVDVGFVFNRDGGINPNVALYWNETTDSIVAAFTSSTGGANSNIAVSSFANLTINSLTASSLSVAGGGLNGVSIGATTPSTGNFTTVQVNNSFYANSGIPSTSTTTGAIVITSPGGIGVGGNIVAGQLNSIGNIIATGAVLNALTVNGTTTAQAINSTGFINTSGNVSAAVANIGALNVTGTLTAAQLNTSGNILAQGAVFNTERVNGTSTVNVLNSTGNILGTGAVLSSAQINGILTSTGLATLAGINSSANILATGGIFSSLTVNGGIASTGFINTTGNVSAAVVNTGALNATGTTTLVAVNSTGFINTTGNVSASQLRGGTATVTGQAFVGELFVTTNSGDEGGQLNLAPAVTNNTLVGNVVIDVWQSRLRIFESGGTNRGGYFDLSTANANVGTNFAAGGGGGGTPGGTNGQVQFNNVSAFGGAANLIYNVGNGVVQMLSGVSSTSVGTGALQVTGGVGITQNINAGGNLKIGTVGAISGQFHTIVGNITQTSSGGAVYFNTTGNIIAANIIAGGVRQTTSTTAPTVATVGDQWYDSEQDTLLQYIFDGTNFFWVDVSGQTLNVNISTVQGTSLSITGNGTVGGNLTVTGFMVGKSTQALYADLAEKYAADSDYEPGIVLVFGGDAEVTQSTSSHVPTVAGVVSTNPAYLMNSGQIGASVALTGRVPCWVKGPVNKGDRVVTSDIPGVAEQLDLTRYQPGCIIGKSLESVEDGEVRKIEVVVGKI